MVSFLAYCSALQIHTFHFNFKINVKMSFMHVEYFEGVDYIITISSSETLVISALIMALMHQPSVHSSLIHSIHFY